MTEPVGAVLTIGLWLDRPAELLEVADVLVAHGARYTGGIAEGDPGQAFSWRFELEGVTRAEGLAAGEVRRRAAGGRAYGVDLDVPGAGPAVVTYAGTPAAGPPQRHPVLIQMPADAWGIPRFAWDDDDRRAAGSLQPIVLRHLEALCTALDPAYAVLGVEAPIPTPAALAAGEPIGPDAYLSARFPVGPVEAPAVLEWATGTFYSGWFLAEGPTTLPAAATSLAAQLRSP
jgi:hypothetical protein